MKKDFDTIMLENEHKIAKKKERKRIRIGKINLKKFFKSIIAKLLGFLKEEWFVNLRKKIRTNFFAGLGLGLIIASVMIMIFTPSAKERKLEEEEINKQVAEKVATLTDAQIIEKAKSYGMKFPEEIDEAIE